jgi:hypothetical protein
MGAPGPHWHLYGPSLVRVARKARESARGLCAHHCRPPADPKRSERWNSRGSSRCAVTHSKIFNSKTCNMQSGNRRSGCPATTLEPAGRCGRTSKSRRRRGLERRAFGVLHQQRRSAIDNRYAVGPKRNMRWGMLPEPAASTKIGLHHCLTVLRCFCTRGRHKGFRVIEPDFLLPIAASRATMPDACAGWPCEHLAHSRPGRSS